MDPGLNSLLQWGIANSEASQLSPEDHANAPPQARGLSADALRALMGGPSDADLMREGIAIIQSDETTKEAKLTAFDNFEQLVENIDNANNIESLGLWPPLISTLSSPEPEIRVMAAWCIGTAVQNNIKAQQKMLSSGGIPKLCKIVLEDTEESVRRKAVYALSSEVRNFQPGMDEMVKNLPKEFTGPDHLSAMDMDVIDAIMAKMREN